jgi:hypothetical protein
VGAACAGKPVVARSIALEGLLSDGVGDVPSLAGPTRHRNTPAG